MKKGERSDNTSPGVGSRRLSPRYQFHAKVEVLPMDVRYSRIWGVSEDISHRGMLIKADRSLEIDTLLVLKIHASSGLLKLVARVVHNIKGVGFGCEFIELDERQKAMLSQLVSQSSSAPPSARTIHVLDPSR